MPATTTLPTLSYQEGRLLMDEKARLRGIESIRTITHAYRVAGPLDIAVLDEALRLLIRRHEALRTSFPSGPTHQVLHDTVDFRCVVVDLAGAPEAAERIRREARTQLSPEQTPRLRVTVLRLAPNEHILVLVFDHLIVDGWARGVLLRELSAAYGAIAAGVSPDLPDVGFRYTDLVHTQRDLLRGADGARLRRFWSDTLGPAGAIPRLPVPKRPPGAPAAGGFASRALPTELVHQLRLLAARERVTLFMVVLCALQVCLRRSTGMDDQAVAVNVYNRETIGTENLVAPLAELLVVRTDLAGARDFSEALRRARASSLSAQEHGEMPYAELVKSFNPNEYGDPDVPIGIVLNMQYEQIRDDSLELSGTDVRVYPISDEGFRPRSELMLVGEAGDGLTFSAYYQADRLPDPFVTGLLDALAGLLETVTTHPDHPLGARHG